MRLLTVTFLITTIMAPTLAGAENLVQVESAYQLKDWTGDIEQNSSGVSLKLDIRRSAEYQHNPNGSEFFLTLGLGYDWLRNEVTLENSHKPTENLTSISTSGNYCKKVHPALGICGSIGIAVISDYPFSNTSYNRVMGTYGGYAEGYLSEKLTLTVGTEGGHGDGINSGTFFVGLGVNTN